MYEILLIAHSLFRWLVVIALLLAIFRAWKGWKNKLIFSKRDNTLRHWTATIAHVQLMIGIGIYTLSPAVSVFLKTRNTAIVEAVFFGLIHSLLMLIAIIVITIGSAKAKRAPADQEKFRVQFTWFLIALIIIFIAVPWPFSPLAHRPFIRL